jgi:hypothetical protein
MSKFQVIVPLIIIVLVGSLNRYLSVERSKNVAEGGEYRYPVSIVYMLYACLLSPLFLFIAPDDVVKDAQAQFVFMGIFAVLIIVASIVYCSRYAIKLKKDAIEFGAFSKREIKYKSIKLAKYHWVNNGQHLKLTLDTGASKTFERGVVDFDGFVKALYQKLDKASVSFSSAGRGSFE